MVNCSDRTLVGELVHKVCELILPSNDESGMERVIFLLNKGGLIKGLVLKVRE